MKAQELPQYVVRIKNDLSVYRVLEISWLKNTVTIYKAYQYETIPFTEVVDILSDDEYLKDY